MKIVIALVMIAIIVSLASGMFYLVKEGKGDSRKVVKSLTFRIGLSLLLFGFLIFAYAMGWIAPHGIGGKG